MRNAHFPVLGLAMVWLIGHALSATAAGPSPFDDAVAVWHFKNLDDSAGANSGLTRQGEIQVGAVPDDAARAASAARGGDGHVAVCSGGFLVPNQGADGELSLTGDAITLYARLQNADGNWGSCGIVSKHGGHERLTYNLYGNAGNLGFELGTDRGLFRVDVAAGKIGPADWHDVVVRYDGKTLELSVDGVQVDDRPAAGSLRSGHREPLVLAGYSVDGQLRGPFRGRLDTVALWKRPLGHAEIVALSGGDLEVAKRRTALEEARYADLPGPVAAYRKVVKSTDVATYSRAALALRKWMIAGDPHRPVYHFTGPESWINDPNGPIYFEGRYHLFYQFDPVVPDGHAGWRRSKRCWGHAVSDDLVRWVDWPVALWPDSLYDREGVYSGNTFVDRDGSLGALYTGNVAGHRETYGMLARSTDGGLTWQKRMVMDDSRRPNADSPVHWDGQVWRDGDRWCQLIGGTTGGSGRQGAAWLWTSPDLVHWTLQKNIAPSIDRGGYWELPYLIPLAGRHVLLVGHGNPYWIGSYDGQAMLFRPDSLEPMSVDNGTYYSFNVNMTDDKGPGGSRRQLMHGWVTGPASPTKSVPYWQGAHSIPRVLVLSGGGVAQQPIPEIERLRGKHRRWKDVAVEPDKAEYLPDVGGDALELIAEFDGAKCQATRFGLKLRVSGDGREWVRVWLDPKTNQFGTDGAVTRKASASGGVTRARLELPTPPPPQSQVAQAEPVNEPVTLRIFLDRSILEVYCGGVAVTGRTFSDPKALGIDLFAEGGSVKLISLDLWEMRSMWDR